MNNAKTKRLTLIALIAAVIVLTAAMIFAPTTGKTAIAANMPIAPQAAAITVPDADYEFTITESGAVYSATVGGLTFTNTNTSISDLIAAIDAAATAAWNEGTDADGILVKKLIFGTSGATIDLDGQTAELTKDTYLIEGKVTSTATRSTNAGGTLLVKVSSADTVYITGAGTAILNTNTTTSACAIHCVSGNLTVTDGAVSASAGYAIYNYGGGGVTVNGGEVSTTSSSSASYAIYNNATGSVTINSGEVSATAGRALYNNGNGSVTVNGGKVLSTTGYAIYNSGVGGVTINGGEVSASSGADYTIFNYATGSLIINGGTVSAEGDDGVAIRNYSTGTITINQGSGDETLITSAVNKANYGTITMGTQANLTQNTTLLKITGGTVENTSLDSANSCAIIDSSQYGDILITGGTVSAKAGAAIRGNKADTVITISDNAVITSEATEDTLGTIVFSVDGCSLKFLGGLIANTAGGNLVYNSTSSQIIIGDGAGAVTVTSTIGFVGLGGEFFYEETACEPLFTVSGLTTSNYTIDYRNNNAIGTAVAVAILDAGLGCAADTRFEGVFIIKALATYNDTDAEVNITYAPDLTVKDVSEIDLLIADGYVFADEDDSLTATAVGSPKVVIGLRAVGVNEYDRITVTITVAKAAGNSTTGTASVTYNPDLTVADALGDYGDYTFADALDSLTVADSGKQVTGYKDNADGANYEQDSVTVTITVEKAAGVSDTDTASVTYSVGLKVKDVVDALITSGYTFADAEELLYYSAAGQPFVGYKDNADGANYEQDSVTVTITVEKAAGVSDTDTASVTYSVGLKVKDVVAALITSGYTFADAEELLYYSAAGQPFVGYKDNADSANYEQDSITVTITVAKAAGNSTTGTASVTYNPNLTVADALGDYGDYTFADAGDSLTVADSGKQVTGYKDNADSANYEQDSIEVTINVAKAAGVSDTETASVTYSVGLKVEDVGKITALITSGYVFADAAELLYYSATGQTFVGYKDNADSVNYEQDNVTVTISVSKAGFKDTVGTASVTYSLGLTVEDVSEIAALITSGYSFTAAGDGLTVAVSGKVVVGTRASTDDNYTTERVTVTITVSKADFKDTVATASVTYSENLTVEDVSEIDALIIDGYVFADAGDGLTVAVSGKVVVGERTSTDDNYTTERVTITITVTKADYYDIVDTATVTYSDGLTVEDVSEIAALIDAGYAFADAGDGLTVLDSGKVVVGTRASTGDNYTTERITVTITVEKAAGNSETDTATVTYSDGLTVEDVSEIAAFIADGYVFADAAELLYYSAAPQTFIGYKDNADGVNYERDSVTVTITVNKFTPAAPAAPTLNSKTDTSITLNVIAGAEYSKDNGGAWQDGNVFTGLTANTEYTFIARIKATDNGNASGNSANVKITTSVAPKTTPAAPAAPTVSGNPTKNSITVEVIPGAEYSINGGLTWQDSNVFTGLEANTEYTVIARIKATDTANASAASTVITVITPKGGLSGGAIAGIVIGGVFILALGGFAIFWFVIKKKNFTDLINGVKNVTNKAVNGIKKLFKKGKSE